MQTMPECELHIFLLLKFSFLDKLVDENYIASQLPTMDQKAGIETGASIICG